MQFEPPPPGSALSKTRRVGGFFSLPPLQRPVSPAAASVRVLRMHPPSVIRKKRKNDPAQGSARGCGIYPVWPVACVGRMQPSRLHGETASLPIRCGEGGVSQQGGEELIRGRSRDEPWRSIEVGEVGQHGSAWRGRRGSRGSSPVLKGRRRRHASDAQEVNPPIVTGQKGDIRTGRRRLAQSSCCCGFSATQRPAGPGRLGHVPRRGRATITCSIVCIREFSNSPRSE